MSPRSSRPELLPGTLEMLILQTLTEGTLHGYGIAQHIQHVSEQRLTIEEGSLYPALQRLQAKKWVSSEWRQTPNNRRARYYTITNAGRKKLGQEISTFEQLLTGIRSVLRTS